jgi:hypothetical protein
MVRNINIDTGVSENSFKTILDSTEYSTKNLNLESKVYNTINELTNQSNRKVSNGVLIYELFMLYNDSCSDLISEREDTVNDKLLKYVSEPDIDEIDDYHINKDANAVMRDLTPDKYEPNEIINSIKIRLPKTLVESVEFTRGWNKRIKKYLKMYIKSPYNCRADRISAKQEMYKYHHNNIKPQERVTRILDNISTKDSSIEDLNDYYAVADNLSSWSERKAKLYEITLNLSLAKEQVKTVIRKAHSIHTDSYLDKIVDEFWIEYDLYYELYEDHEEVTYYYDTVSKKTVLNNNVIDTPYDAIYVAQEIEDDSFVREYINPQIDEFDIVFNNSDLMLV